METKKCPHCGEEIMAVAKKCRHCGEWLDLQEQTKIVDYGTISQNVSESKESTSIVHKFNTKLIIITIVGLIIAVFTLMYDDSFRSLITILLYFSGLTVFWYGLTGLFIGRHDKKSQSRKLLVIKIGMFLSIIVAFCSMFHLDFILDDYGWCFYILVYPLCLTLGICSLIHLFTIKK